jgi:signal transduction histidine kinase
MAKAAEPAQGKTTITRTLARAVTLLALVPFLPLAYLTWHEYALDVERVEREIETTNSHIASLAAQYLDGVVRQVEQQLALGGTRPGPRLPEGPAAVVWERVGRDGTVVDSQVSAARVGKPCGYDGFARALRDGSGPARSEVGGWLEGHPVTVLFGIRGEPGSELLVGVLEPEVLHRELVAYTAVLDRHVYAVDRDGRLLFYSDLERFRRGLDLADNPPVRLFKDGGQGRIRFRSSASGKERLGHVRRLLAADWGVVVTADIGQGLLGIRGRYRVLGWTIAFALIAASGILLWTSRSLVQPLLAIRSALRADMRGVPGPLKVGASARKVAEYDELVRAFDDLATRYAQTERELVEAERVASVGELASGIAHEVGTPLNVISGNAQYLLRKMGQDAPQRATLQMIVKQTERIAGLIRSLLDYARPTEPRMVPVDLRNAVEQVVETARGLGNKVSIEVRSDAAPPRVLGDPKLLEHALMNLVMNAHQAMPEGGTLTISVELVTDTPGPGAVMGETWVVCRVADTGCGIAPENLDKLFQPFFTTKPHGQGTGLGLALVDRIVRQLGGRVSVRSEPGKGSTFTIWLRPAPGRARAARPAGHDARRPPQLASPASKESLREG